MTTHTLRSCQLCTFCMAEVGACICPQDKHDIEIPSNEAAWEADQRWHKFIESRKTKRVFPGDPDYIQPDPEDEDARRREANR